MGTAARMISPRTASFLVLAALAAVLFVCRLGPAFLAGIFSYTAIDFIHRPLSARIRPPYAKWLSLGAFLLAVFLLAWMTGYALRQSLTALPDILERSLPRVGELCQRFGVTPPFDDIDDLRRIIMASLRENARDITHASGILTKGFLHVLLGMAVAILAFMSAGRPAYGPNLYDAVREELDRRIGRLARSFELVLGAQASISAINTLLTAIFLLALGFPYTAFLIPATFLLGLLPVIGNLLSNTIIVCTALTMSPRHAALALGFLVLIHKGEYLLNSKIIGSSIQAPMWQTLLGILLGEAVLGVPGIILAPAVQHYIRQELQAVPCPRSGG